MKKIMTYFAATKRILVFPCTRIVSVLFISLWLLSTNAVGDDYYHFYESPSGWWGDSEAWFPAGVPGPGDSVTLSYGIRLGYVDSLGVEHPGGSWSVGTVSLDTYITFGPAPDIDLRSGELNILDGGVWQWGGINDFYYSTGVVNQHGTMRLVDDISDHLNNGSGTVDLIQHNVDWGVTFNNYGTMQHEGLGSLNIGVNASQYNNYGSHEFVNDGDITTSEHGGETMNNMHILRKSGGIGQSDVAPAFTNHGTVEAQTGTILIGNSLDFESLSTHELLGGKWVISDNAGIVISARGELETNSGHVVLNGPNANLYTTQTSVFTPIEDSLLLNSGTMEVFGDRIFANSVTNAGVWIGTGEIELTSFANEGLLQPGTSAGALSIDGYFFQSATGELSIELGGLAAGTEYDVLDVSGTAMLGGHLDAVVLPAFDLGTVSFGTTFDILVAETLIGEFDSVNLPAGIDIDYLLSDSAPDRVQLTYVGLESVPESFDVVTGELVAGTLADLTHSDDNYLFARKKVSQISGGVTIGFQTSIDTEIPVAMEFKLESSALARSDVLQTIELFNYDTDQYEPVDTRNVSRNGDQVVTVALAGDLSRFVQPDSRSLEARISYFSAIPRHRYVVRIDNVNWAISN